MELWKLHKYCEGATLAELRKTQRQLERLLDSDQLKDTNAERALVIVREYRELKALFER